MLVVVGFRAVSRVSVHVYHKSPAAICDLVMQAAPGRRVVPVTSREELLLELGDVEVLFAPIPPREGWAGADRLRLVQLLGAGVDQLLPSPDLPERVEVAGVRGVFAAEASEYAMAAMLCLCRRFPALFSDQRERKFRQRAAGTVVGRNLTIVGLGSIGQRIAYLASAHGMTVTGVCRRPRDIPPVDHVLAVNRLAEALSSAEYLVVTVPLTPATAGLLSAEMLACLPDGAFLINIARGGIVDEAALIDELKSGRLGGAALDVFEQEPLPEDSPLWNTPNLIVTPHVAGYGQSYVERCVDVLVENVRRLETGEPRLHLVDRALGY